MKPKYIILAIAVMAIGAVACNCDWIHFIQPEAHTTANVSIGNSSMDVWTLEGKAYLYENVSWENAAGLDMIIVHEIGTNKEATFRRVVG